MTHLIFRCTPVILAMAFLGHAGQAFAQTGPPKWAGIPTDTLRMVWNRVAKDDTVAAAQIADAKGPEARQAVYEALLRKFLEADEFKDVRLERLHSIINEVPESASAISTNASLTNPGTNQLMERSGLTDLLALSSDFRQLFSSSGTAMSLSLNAIALFGNTNATEGRSAPYRYAQREAWRRLGGTITFGAKVPEKEITGISGLPNSETLFDALSWDIKLRLVGDRDSRASRWAPLLVGTLGERLSFLTRLQGMGLVATADLEPFRAAAAAVLGEELGEAKDEIASSLQISVKTSGVHLTTVSGKNKYTIATMLDKGVGGLDLTLNVAYNVADSTHAVTGAYSARDFQIAAGLTGSVLKDVLVSGRSAEISASVKGQLINDGANATADRRNTFNVNTTLTLPFQKQGKIPFSITWTNDPNNLTKQQYVRGQIGLSYDFGSIMGLLKDNK
jgi:hypothetical protein